MPRLHIKDHSSSDFRPRAWGQISVTFMYYRSINLRSSKKVKGWIISRSNKLLSSSLLNTIFNLLKVNVAEFYFNGVYHYQCCELFSKAIFSYNRILTTFKKNLYEKKTRIHEFVCFAYFQFLDVFWNPFCVANLQFI